jgi:hypothetical protein
MNFPLSTRKKDNPLVAATSTTAELEQMTSGVNWELELPFAARELMISADPRDYLITPSPMMYSDLPNRNGFAFPLQELIKWNVELGCQAYRGWVGMPMYKEHKSDDHKKAIGMVIDTRLVKIASYGKGVFWKVMALSAIDRNKDPELAERIEKGEQNSFSMGAMVDYCTCSYCDAVAGKCSHVPESNDSVSFYKLNGRLVYKNVHNVKPYEYSSVSDPAFGSAHSDIIMRY